MIVSKHPKTVTNLLQTALAKPYHYRRSGRYYLRLRPQGATQSFLSLSLRTTDKTTAMAISHEILKTLKAYQFDNPNASWPQLRERLLEIAEYNLTMEHGDSSLLAYSMIHDEHHAALREASAKLSLSFNQQLAISKALEVIDATQERLKGKPAKLLEIVQELSTAHSEAAEPQSVCPPDEPLTWDHLSTRYMSEHCVNIKATTKASMLTNYNVIKGAFEKIGLTDLRTHSRDDMVKIRTELLKGRQISTVNNLLTKMMTVMSWAVDNDYLAKAYTSNLKLTKGADSKRESFTKDQVITLMNHANTLPDTSWERWCLLLLAITGARVGEIAFLTPKDIKMVDGLWCIDINEDGPNKSVKNKHSLRLIPLIDGAFNLFDLGAFLKAVEAGALPSDNGISPQTASKKLGVQIKAALGKSRSKNQTLHSLRHFVSSALQAEGVPVAYVQAIAGHSSRTVTFDTYGSAVPVSKLADELKKVLTT